MFKTKIVLFLLLLASTAEAQPASTDIIAPMPQCGPEMDGQIVCKSGRTFECQFVDPNSMERRTGWRWKSDILRACAEPRPAPVGQANGGIQSSGGQSGGGQKDGLPPGFTYAPQYNGSAGGQSDTGTGGGRPGNGQGGFTYPNPDGSQNAYPVYRRN